MLPDVGVAIFIATNGPGGSVQTLRGMESLMLYLLDQAAGLEPWLAGDGVCSYPLPWIGSEPKAPLTPQENEEKFASEEILDGLDLQPFVGNYIHPAFGTIHIELNASDGHLHFRWGRLGRAKLYRIDIPDQQDIVIFRSLWEGAYDYDTSSIIMKFNETNKDGMVPALMMSLESTPDYFVRDSLYNDDEWTCPCVEGECYDSGATIKTFNCISCWLFLLSTLYTSIHWTLWTEASA